MTKVNHSRLQGRVIDLTRSQLRVSGCASIVVAVQQLRRETVSSETGTITGLRQYYTVIAKAAETNEQGLSLKLQNTFAQDQKSSRHGRANTLVDLTLRLDFGARLAAEAGSGSRTETQALRMVWGSKWSRPHLVETAEMKGSPIKIVGACWVHGRINAAADVVGKRRYAAEPTDPKFFSFAFFTSSNSGFLNGIVPFRQPSTPNLAQPSRRFLSDAENSDQAHAPDVMTTLPGKMRYSGISLVTSEN
ncbi:hypothetical protein K438DRAFT_1775811 [Mycena galopus ATCC 62051]|nr:hypothetical protein K438DRAFT_1775811 [Mycena galopus ATCC 62051]